MPLSSLTGTRLRERRLATGLRQADVAAAAGISASYLNLIEHNRRKVTPEVADRLSDVLGLDKAALTGSGAAALLEGLRSAAGRNLAVPAELERLEEFVGRFPGWAGLVADLDGRVEGLERALAAMNDRMTHDPHLSQALHELLSSLASVRATAAILAETPDLSSDWLDKFHLNLHGDSERLASGAEALVAFLDAGSAIAEQGIAAPQEEVEDWLSRRNWTISDDELLAGLDHEVAALASSAARSLAEAHLAQAAADAALLPAAVLAAAIAAEGADALAIAGALGLEPPVVMRRLAAVPALVVGLVICDGSGTLTFRKPAVGFPLPRFGAACPLWPLYAALGHPRQPCEALVESAGQGRRSFRVQAWCESHRPAGPRGPELRQATMLVLPAGGAAVGTPGGALVVGSSCRICPRPDCPARREPTILSEAG
jgi:transcriptional regulator with XRE-family HTH domain